MEKNLTQRVDDALLKLSGRSDLSQSDAVPSLSGDDPVSTRTQEAGSFGGGVHSQQRKVLKICAVALTSVLCVLVVVMCVKRYYQTNRDTDKIFAQFNKEKEDRHDRTHTEDNNTPPLNDDDPLFTVIDFSNFVNTK